MTPEALDTIKAPVTGAVLDLVVMVRLLRVLDMAQTSMRPCLTMGGAHLRGIDTLGPREAAPPLTVAASPPNSATIELEVHSADLDRPRGRPSTHAIRR
jgi:hypothetical protein